MRIVLYDRTCVRRGNGLTPLWAIGSRLYRQLERVDVVRGVASWAEALDHVTRLPAPIRELQFWGHGNWGNARIDREVLDARALVPTHRLHARLEALRERLAPGALVWFRTCETFGARAGLEFAERLAGFLGARVAGHTFVINFHQSGLHGLAPGVRPDWSPSEGIAEGTAEQPRRAKLSLPWAPRTITCFTSAVPSAWFARAPRAPRPPGEPGASREP